MLEEQERIERQERLGTLITGLASIDSGILSQELIEDKTRELREIYGEDFRHQYSALFPVIVSITEDEKSDVDVLTENLRLVMECVGSKHDSSEDLSKHLLKLIDHINLELSRNQVAKADKRKLTTLHQENACNRAELIKTENSLELATAQLKEVNQKAENMMTQVISVLSIFAAIVVAFAGGINFLGNAISSIQNVYIYKSVLICMICGLVLFNLVFLMMYIVGKIINRSIFARCDTECSSENPNKSSCKCGSDCTKSCGGFNRIRKRLPYVFWVNIAGLSICALDVLAWFLRLYRVWPFSF